MVGTRQPRRNKLPLRYLDVLRRGAYAGRRDAPADEARGPSMTFAVVVAILQSQQDQAPRQLFGFPPGIFWPYFVCILFFVLGLIRLLFFKRALSEAKGLDKFIVFGPLLFA